MGRRSWSGAVLVLAACWCGACSKRLDFDKFHPGASPDAGPRLDAPSAKDGLAADRVQGCNPVSLTLAQSPPPEVYLVLDRSGSMIEQGSTPSQTRWQEMNAAVSLVLNEYEDSIRFGVLTYPSDNLCRISGPQVPVGLFHSSAIKHHLEQALPAGGTPTAAALNNAAQSLQDLGDQASAKFIVLATDGGPNCNHSLSAKPQCVCTHAASDYCCTSFPLACYAGHTCLDEENVLAVLKRLNEQLNIFTFVIGLDGTSEYKTLLNQMAKAGGVPRSGEVSYIPAANKAELMDALQAIAVKVVSCEISFGQTPQFPDRVLLYLDGTLVPRSTTKSQGWDYSDVAQTKATFYGSYCEALQQGGRHSITATFACDGGRD